MILLWYLAPAKSCTFLPNITAALFKAEIGNALRNNTFISNWRVFCVADMSAAFDDQASFNQDISEWDVSAVTSMSYMFYVASSFNQPIGNWNTSAVYSKDVVSTLNKNNII